MTAGPLHDARRRLPSVDRLLEHPAVLPLAAVYGRHLVTVQARAALALRRRELATAAEGAGPLATEPGSELDRLVAALSARLERLVAPPLRRVINATGVLLHTNLGRAPLPRSVLAELPALLDAGCDLELDLVSGRRGDRGERVASLLAALTGAPTALAVNNNAAALVLALATHAAGREVVISRGELVEIGGAFRIPEILATAGARLVEVGTTNRTHLEDYRRAIGPATALLLKVYPSNYRLTGYVAGVAPAALAALAHEHGLALLVDEGSGLLRPHPAPQLQDHPSHAELIGAGCDLVCGSGDKVLGGPQAGLLLGRESLVAACRRHPLYRALRLDRLTLAALEGVLRLHLAAPTQPTALPLAGLWPEPERHRVRLAGVAAALGGPPQVTIAAADAFLGAGSAPEAAIAGEAIALAAAGDLLTRLRQGDPAVMATARQGLVWIDLRTVDPADDEALVAAVSRARLGVSARPDRGPSP